MCGNACEVRDGMGVCDSKMNVEQLRGMMLWVGFLRMRMRRKSLFIVNTVGEFTCYEILKTSPNIRAFSTEKGHWSVEFLNKR